MLKTAIFAALCCVVCSFNADARPRHVSPAVCVDSGDIMRPCAPVYGVRATAVRHSRPVASNARYASSEVIGGRPAGCPRAFCGCGASLHLFGRIIPSLNLAANWFRFPRAAPAPKMAAVRRHHVFVLEQHISGNIWLAFDANGGGHATWLHARSIAGYVIVNPSGAS